MNTDQPAEQETDDTQHTMIHISEDKTKTKNVRTRGVDVGIITHIDLIKK